MKFLKDNWFCLLMFIIAILSVVIMIVRIITYDERIQKHDAKIEEYKSWNDQLNAELEARMDELDSIEATIPLYSDSINDLIRTRILMKRRYEKQISDILAIPVDSVYREVTRWLDSR